jgi:sugar O-acyltransferase (sialic acid O-acetyltransferase NeuD family)
MTQAVIIFPFGGNAREVVVLIEAINAVAPLDARYEILGFLDDNHASLKSSSSMSYSILGGSERWVEYRGKAKLVAVPGSPSSFRKRQALLDRLDLRAEDTLTLIDPFTRVASMVRLGHNTVVMAGGFISSDVGIGNHCVILPNSVVSHDAQVGDYTLIGSGVSVSGSVVIGKGCYIGSKASVREGVRIGDGVLVGMGANVLDDVPDNAVVVGNPARQIRS